MGDDMDIEYTPSFSSSCGLSKTVRDCDGYLVTMCLSTSNCPYKKVVRDCDGDYIELCQK